MLSDKNMAVQLEVFIDVGMTRMDTIIQQKYTVSLFLYTFSNFKNGKVCWATCRANAWPRHGTVA